MYHLKKFKCPPYFIHKILTQQVVLHISLNWSSVTPVENV